MVIFKLSEKDLLKIWLNLIITLFKKLDDLAFIQSFFKLLTKN